MIDNNFAARAFPDPPESPARLTGEMWGITTYFNPVGYNNKYDHLRVFSEAVRRQGLKLVVIELSLRGQPRRVSEQDADVVLYLTSDTVLWHKERLLNIALNALPPSCDKVAWVDGDLLFENSEWVAETSNILERYVLVQPFQHYYMLPQDKIAIPESEREREGISNLPGMAYANLTGDPNYVALSVPGGAWAARRSLVQEHGFYDKLILGAGDAAMCWAMYGLTEDYVNNGWLRLVLPEGLSLDLRSWSQAFHHDANRSVSYTPGRVFHLWHGERKRRRYVLRLMILREASFDPTLDITLDPQQCWRWSSDKPDLHRKVEEYFNFRREEG